MPPNILLFMTDSMDGRVMRHLGHPAAHTPNMDRLAALGTSFSNAYCNSPQCAPSRASFWSGQYVHRVQAWNNPGGLPLNTPTFGTHLEDAGYGLHVFGKTDYRVGGHSLKARLTAWLRSANIKRPHNPRPQATTFTSPDLHPLQGERQVPASSAETGEGSSARNPTPTTAHLSPEEATTREYLSPDQTPTRLHQKDWIQIDAACQFLNNYSKDDPPYLLYPSTNVPHPPFRATRHYLDKIDPAAVTLPPYEPDLHPVMDYMSVTKNTHGHFTDEEILAIRRHYFAMVAETDAMLGQVLDTLEATGQLNDTYIIFASDHGEMNMEHRQTLKNALYEASARVPLIVAGPGLQQGVISDELVSLIDLFPTLMDIAGLDHPQGLDGVSLLPLCRGEASNRPDYVFSEYHSNFSNTGIAMWRQGPWKYIRYAGYPPQLFNLDDDPEEIDDLAQSRPEIVKELDARLESLVDFNHADTQAKRNDRHNYQTWRQSLTHTEIQEALTKSHQGHWTPGDDEEIENWLAKS
ncbi:MAG: sulfatase-like hydrolase/transferase [Chloroflexota bacterium]|nr:sulfatase-like hydrolase/transferase [Chloroflexota bacterium]